MRRPLKVPHGKSKDLSQPPVNHGFGDMHQLISISDRREWLFSQDGPDVLIDFITYFDLLIGGRRVI
jgi:hypothetical protein